MVACIWHQENYTLLCEKYYTAWIEEECVGEEKIVWILLHKYTEGLGLAQYVVPCLYNLLPKKIHIIIHIKKKPGEMIP